MVSRAAINNYKTTHQQLQNNTPTTINTNNTPTTTRQLQPKEINTNTTSKLICNNM
jgi:hypothetical protein